jgi:hypothetical protein
MLIMNQNKAWPRPANTALLPLYGSRSKAFPTIFFVQRPRFGSKQALAKNKQ